MIEADDCRVVGAHTRRFRRCRAADPYGELFTIDECPAGHVINILSAEMGYSVLYNTTTTRPQCPWRNCTAPFEPNVPAMECNGFRRCTFSQDLLIFTSGSALCELHNDANFVRIEFTCVTGMSLVFYCTASFYIYNTLCVVYFSKIKVLCRKSLGIHPCILHSLY